MSPVLWFLLVISAIALHPPVSTDVVDSIAAQLAEAHRLQLEINTRDADSQFYQGDAGWEARTKELEGKRNEYLNRAVYEALTGYGIVPRNEDGSPKLPSRAAAMPRLKGESISWQPFVRANGPLPLERTDGTVVDEDPIPSDKAAGTTQRGFTNFRPDALVKMQPLDLALLLIHEKRHFDSFTMPSEKNLTRGEREVKALEAEELSMEALGVPLDLRRSKVMKLDKAKQEAWKEHRRLEHLRYSPLYFFQKGERDSKIFGCPETRVFRQKIQSEAEAFAQKVHRESVVRHVHDLHEIADRCCFPPEDGSPCVSKAALASIGAQPADFYWNQPRSRETSCSARLYNSMLDVLARGENLSAAWLDAQYLPIWTAVYAQSRHEPATAQRVEPSPAPPTAADRGIPSWPEVSHPRMAPLDAAQRLATLAQLACSSPGAISESHVADTDWFLRGDEIGMTKEVEAGLSGCSLQLYREILSWYGRSFLLPAFLNLRAKEINAVRAPYGYPIGGTGDPGAAPPPPRDPLDLSKARKMPPKIRGFSFGN